MKKTEKTIAPFKALYWILISILLVTGSSAVVLFFFLKWQHKQKTDPKYLITTIVQTGPEKNALTTEYLAEILGLSRNRPAHLMRFDVKRAETALTRSPLIKRAKVSVIKPQTVYIDYTVRKPLAWIFEYENTAIDEEGYLFPVYPFFTPKQLPELYLGLIPFGKSVEMGERGPGQWNVPLQGKYVTLGIDLLKRTRNLNIRRIDLSNAYAETLGSREIVIYLEDEILTIKQQKETLGIIPRLIRLSTKDYLKELGNFFQLRENLLAKEKEELIIPGDASFIYTCPLQVIDLRIDGMGMIEVLKKEKE